MKPLSIYIHIPFCKRKCLYCDFPSYSNCENEYESYVNSLLNEIEYSSSEYNEYEIKTIFVGGGTPTVLPTPYMGKIMDKLFSKYNIDNQAEITIEANPATINENSLREYKAMYFNRISLGVQAWQNRLLEGIGRIHTIETFIKNYEEVRQSGIENVSIDLMFSLPNQTINDWKETLENIIKLRPDHISTYSLIIEEGTPFYKMEKNREIKVPDEELDREMYYIAIEMLKNEGYEQYEISNFAQKAKKSRHNIVYWQDEEYIGFGLGSHSYFRGERFHNTYDMKQYILCKGNILKLREDIEIVSLENQYSEFMFMGLRLTNGVENERFRKRFGKNINDIYKEEIEKLKYEKLIFENNGRVALTSRGIDISNYVFEQFLI